MTHTVCNYFTDAVVMRMKLRDDLYKCEMRSITIREERVLRQGVFVSLSHKENYTCCELCSHYLKEE